MLFQQKFYFELNILQSFLGNWIVGKIDIELVVWLCDYTASAYQLQASGLLVATLLQQIGAVDRALAV